LPIELLSDSSTKEISFGVGLGGGSRKELSPDPIVNLKAETLEGTLQAKIRKGLTLAKNVDEHFQPKPTVSKNQIHPIYVSASGKVVPLPEGFVVEIRETICECEKVKAIKPNLDNFRMLLKNNPNTSPFLKKADEMGPCEEWRGV
jgi:hypothetical protein